MNPGLKTALQISTRFSREVRQLGSQVNQANAQLWKIAGTTAHVGMATGRVVSDPEKALEKAAKKVSYHFFSVLANSDRRQAEAEERRYRFYYQQGPVAQGKRDTDYMWMRGRRLGKIKGAVLHVPMSRIRSQQKQVREVKAKAERAKVLERFDNKTAGPVLRGEAKPGESSKARTGARQQGGRK
jgi:hypothetical protein